MGEIAKKVKEIMWKWDGNVMRSEEHYVGSKAMEMKVGLRMRRKGGRSKTRWLDRVRIKGLSGEMFRTTINMIRSSKNHRASRSVGNSQ